jgi:hypothetical protein
MVVRFDAADGTYKKFLMIDDGKVSKSIGTRVAGSRTISWISLPPADAPAKEFILSSEVHSDDKTYWRETLIRDGEVIGSMEGMATATQKAAVRE